MLALVPCTELPAAAVVLWGVSCIGSALILWDGGSWNSSAQPKALNQLSKGLRQRDAWLPWALGSRPLAGQHLIPTPGAALKNDLGPHWARPDGPYMRQKGKPHCGPATQKVVPTSPSFCPISFWFRSSQHLPPPCPLNLDLTF